MAKSPDFPVDRPLLAGDWHGDLNHARRTIDHAEDHDADAVMQLGDFGYWEHEPAGVEFLDELNSYAISRGLPVYFIDGNHDNIALLRSRYGSDLDEHGFSIVRPFVRYAPRGHRWTWGGSRFIALGGAYSVDKGYRLRIEAERSAKIVKSNRYRLPSARRPTDTSSTVWFPDEEMTDDEFDAILDADSSPVDVILAHDKPRSADPGFNRKNQLGCWANQDHLDLAVRTLKPALFAHGHLHWRYTDHIASGDGTWTRVEGLGSEPSAREPGRPYPDDDSWLAIDLPVAAAEQHAAVAVPRC